MLGFFLILPFVTTEAYQSLYQDNSLPTHISDEFQTDDKSETNQATNPSWLAEAQDGIEAKEYQVSRNATGLQAPNRAHNLRTYFDGQGITVVDRVASDGVELLRMGLAGLSRAQRVDGLDQAAKKGWLDNVSVHSEGNRVELRRDGITEWFVNDAKGLEHGFVIPERLEGEDALRLAMTVTAATAELQDDHVIFSTPSGRNLKYDTLHVEDARGKSIPASFEVPDAGTVVLLISDLEAHYPLTVDPLLTATADRTIESNQYYARLATSVSDAGDVNGDGFADIIVGASMYDNGELDEGVAFVYHGSGSGSSMAPSATLESDLAGAFLGSSVSGAGDLNGDGYDDVVVGADHYDNGQTLEGAFYVCYGSSSGIVTPAAIVVESNQIIANMGHAVSGAGDVNGDGYDDLIVSANLYDNGQENEGVVFVYHGSALGISGTATSTLESDQLYAYLGDCLSSAGDVNGDGYADVIVGANFYDNGQVDEGAAFVYHGGPAGLSSTAAIILEYNQAGAHFADGVSGAGDVNGDGYSDVVVGATDFASGQAHEGAFFVYHGGPSGISPTVETMGQSNQVNAWMGYAVSGAGDVNGDGYADIIVGAHGIANGQAYEGVAMLFHGGEYGVSDVAATWLECNVSGASMGHCVSGAGDVNGDGYADVLIGAPYYSNGQSTEGAAFIYHGGASSLSHSVALVIESNQAYAYFGQCVASAGDVNGDGYADVIVGAYQYDNGQNNEGAAFIYHGSATGLSGVAAAMVESNQTDAEMGWGVSGAGDVDGDGYADVIVGVRRYNGGQTLEGAAFIYHGSSTGISTTATTILESNQANAGFGTTVSNAGDVNGDGFGDVIVGAYRYDGTGGTGAAFVYHGSSSGVSPVAAAMRQFNQTSTQLPNCVSGAGDINGDGYADVVVGVWDYDNGQTNEGALFVYHGSSSGISAVANRVIESNNANWGLGWSVSDAGDVNGDGYADVVAGATGYSNGQTSEGAVFVYLGTHFGLSGTAASQMESNTQYSSYGSSVSCAGDVNGDGYTDVIVGAPANPTQWAYIYHGGPSGVSSVASSILTNNTYSKFGWSLSGAGDLNGDGYGDVIVGGKHTSNGQQEEGACYIYYGNSVGYGNSLGKPVLASQLRSGSSTPVPPWGLSGNPGEFQVQMNATHPEGRGRVKLEVQYTQTGDYFNSWSGGTVVTPVWTDAAIGGVTLTETIPALATDTLYRWRARVLYERYSVTEAGITPHSNPSHGPWRRLSGQSAEADIRTGGSASAVVETFPSPNNFVLRQNVPNPFNPTTHIAFELKNPGHVRLRIYDVAGRLVRNLIDERVTAGRHTRPWAGLNDEGQTVSSGVYFYRLWYNDNFHTRKMMLLK